MPALFSRNRHKANRSRSQELLLLRDEIDQTMEKIDAARNLRQPNPVFLKVKQKANQIVILKIRED